MPQVEQDDERERRIDMEVIVDAHDEEERAMGWFYYLQDNLQVPFTARCRIKRSISPLKVGDEVEVVGMAPAEDCEHDMLVSIHWKDLAFAVPLSQLEVAELEEMDETTEQAVDDWVYWVDRGHQL